MNGVLQSGAWIAAILGGFSVLTGVALWIRKQYRAWRERRRARRHRAWHGYIDIGGVSSWHVRLVDAPGEPPDRVVLEVLASHGGAPDINRAHSLRQQIAADGMLARVPSPAEDDFLKALGRQRGRGSDPQGVPIH